MTRVASPAARVGAIDELHALLRADLADDTHLRYQSANPVHWSVARLASVVTASAGEAPFQHSSTRRVGTRAVERFRAETGRFAAADNHAAGERDREALIRHMIGNVKRLTHGDYSDQVGRALFSAIAEAVLLLTWLTFDVAPASALTQKYSTYARQLAHRADNRLLEAVVFAVMSQQAGYVGVGGNAVELATAARQRTVDGDPPCIRFFDESKPMPWKLMFKTACGYPPADVARRTSPKSC